MKLMRPTDFNGTTNTTAQLSVEIRLHQQIFREHMNSPYVSFDKSLTALVEYLLSEPEVPCHDPLSVGVLHAKKEYIKSPLDLVMESSKRKNNLPWSLKL